MIARTLLCFLLTAAVGALAVAAEKEAQAAIPKVTVTDFSRGAESAYPTVRAAIKAMAADMPCSRAITACLISGRQVRIIRTGVRWVAFPKDAVFLLLGTSQPAGPDLVFAGQREYIQYLARHPDVSEQKPKPLRIAEALKAISRETIARPLQEAAPSTPPKTP